MPKRNSTDIHVIAAGEDARIAWLKSALHSAGYRVNAERDSALGSPKAAARILYVAKEDRQRHVVSILSSVSLLDWEQPWILISPTEAPYSAAIVAKGAAPFSFIKLGTRREVVMKMLDTLREWGIAGLEVNSGGKAGALNERRKYPHQFSLAWAGGLALACLLMGSVLGFWLSHSPHLDRFRPGKQMTQSAPSVSAASTPQPLPAAQSKPKVPPEAEGPPLSAMRPKPIPMAALVMAPPPLKAPTPTELDPRKRDAAALDVVQKMIRDSNRVSGLSAEQIDALASRFAYTVYVEGKGIQTNAGLRASLVLRQEKWPFWKERIQSVSVSPVTPDEVAVLVESEFWAENPARKTKLAEQLRTVYVVSFSRPQQPVIVRVEHAPPLPEGPPVPPAVSRSQLGIAPQEVKPQPTKSSEPQTF